MKLRWKIAFGLVVLAAIGGFLVLGTANRARRDLEQTRRSLRKQGFKIDLKEFDFTTSPELRNRAAILATTTRAAITNRARAWSAPVLSDFPPFITPAGSNAALVAWKLERPKSYRSPDLWATLRELSKTNQARFEAQRQAAVSGPIRFEPIGTGPEALLPYLADLKNLETTFGLETILALHDGDKNAAWANLFAASCLVTSYTPEPIEISHLVRFACASLAFNTTWNALQSGDWTEAQLADLQRRWETADFWSGLPETAAASRANMAVAFQRDRQFRTDLTLKDALRSPKDAWYELKSHWSRLGYLHQGSYEDEKALLLYYRDRELELRRATLCPTWREMRQLPGVTNPVPFISSGPSPVASMLNMRQMSLRTSAQGRGLLGRAAEAESWRRLIITAIALERYHGRHGSYPDALPQLVPDLLASPPTDFIDGQPLRYRRTDDGHFVLYSVGLDCVDNGGQLRLRRQPGARYAPSDQFGSPQGTDLVWPRPASVAEAERLHQEELAAERDRLNLMEEEGAAAQWSHTARRQARVKTILSAPPQVTKEIPYRGRLLSEVLRNEKTFGTNKIALSQMLTLNSVVTGAEPETITFELPISYDVLTNIGQLELYIDPCEDEQSDEGCVAGQFECTRATNGNCLLAWSTIYECPGKHALQAGLVLEDPRRSSEDIVGPLAPFTITNLCQFSLSSAHFQPEHGANLRAKLPEPNGAFRLEIKSPAGERLRTMTGNTSDSIIKVHWDLTDDRGKRCTNNSYDTVFQITLPDSGRSQTLKGP